MTGNIVATRYAKALFSLGQKAGMGELDKYASSLGYLGDAVSKSPALAEVFCSSMFTQNEKRKVLTKLGKSLSLHKTVINFCLLLSERRRMNVLSDIVSAFQSLLDAEKGTIRGKLLTAIDLDDAKRAAYLAELEKKAGTKLELEFGVAPEILGGVILKVGDKVLDASLRAQLSILKDSIKRGE